MPRIVLLPKKTRAVDAVIAKLDLNAAWGLYDKQARFVASNAKFNIFLGGVGSGKTHALIGWIIRRALGNPGSCGALLGRTGNDLGTVLIPSLFDRLEEAQDNCGVCLINDYDRGNAKIHLINGSTIYFRPYNRIAKLRSLTLTYAAADESEWSEANPEEIWSVLTGRLRGHGPLPGLAFATSPNGLRGITKKFVDAQRAYLDAAAKGDVQGMANWGGWYTATATSFDNPHNPPHFYAILRSMSKRRYKQEVEGKVLRPQNTVLDLTAGHLIPWRWQDYPHLPRVYGIDWGTSGNHVGIMIQVTPSGRWVVADELIVDGNTPRGKFQEMLGRWIDGHGRTPPALIAADRACPMENQQLALRYRQTQVRWMEGKEDQAVTTGLELMRDMMDPLDGEPMLVFADHLQQVIPETTAPIIPAIRGYCYHLDADGQPTTRPKKDNVTDHAMDALRYIVTAGAYDPRLHGGRTLLTPRSSTPKHEAANAVGNSGAQA